MFCFVCFNGFVCRVDLCSLRKSQIRRKASLLWCLFFELEGLVNLFGLMKLSLFRLLGDLNLLLQHLFWIVKKRSPIFCSFYASGLSCYLVFCYYLMYSNFNRTYLKWHQITYLPECWVFNYNPWTSFSNRYSFLSSSFELNSFEWYPHLAYWQWSLFIRWSHWTCLAQFLWTWGCLTSFF